MRKSNFLFCSLLFLLVVLESFALAEVGESEDIEKLVTERYFEGAYNYYQEGFYDMAIRFYNMVLERDPKHAKALYWLARLYQELGLYHDALSTWKKLAEVQPDNKVAQYFVKVCEEIIRQGKEPFEIYEKAYIFYSRGEKEKALALYEKSCALNPDFQKAFLWAGRVAFELGNYDKAEWYLERALALDSKDKVAKYLLDQLRRARNEKR
ncbi:MAG: tetratricopeptide repeat protein [Synergistetes bacterium]|nr:tetratricopeptide repeat protein [Synergistota bacterium]MCX8127884.1 tetratricopeptide repeat protein [Synergistota bacterium]MDW8192146.1 tetratricopeptide repeat protein [Synergistota bacterium]